MAAVFDTMLQPVFPDECIDDNMERNGMKRENMKICANLAKQKHTLEREEMRTKCADWSRPLR